MRLALILRTPEAEMMLWLSMARMLLAPRATRLSARLTSVPPEMVKSSTIRQSLPLTSPMTSRMEAFSV